MSQCRLPLGTSTWWTSKRRFILFITAGRLGQFRADFQAHSGVFGCITVEPTMGVEPMTCRLRIGRDPLRKSFSPRKIHEVVCRLMQVLALNRSTGNALNYAANPYT